MMAVLVCACYVCVCMWLLSASYSSSSLGALLLFASSLVLLCQLILNFN